MDKQDEILKNVGLVRNRAARLLQCLGEFEDVCVTENKISAEWKAAYTMSAWRAIEDPLKIILKSAIEERKKDDERVD